MAMASIMVIPDPWMGVLSFSLWLSSLDNHFVLYKNTS